MPKKLLSFLLAASIAASMFPEMAASADIPDRGHNEDLAVMDDSKTESSMIPSPLMESNPATTQEGQIQTYYPENGEAHKIYWTKGITPPLMPSSPADTGSQYFKKVTENDYVTYEAPSTVGSGYYDLNKTATNNYCYLGAAGNMLYWWMDQNAEYIDTYLQKIQDGTFRQEEGLVDISDMNKWNQIRDKSTSMNIPENNLMKLTMGRYLNREDGFTMDRVHDFFLNGYWAYDNLDGSEPVNTEENFRKDPAGGYFHPIFGKKILSRRYENVYYDFYNENLRSALESGLGVTLAFESVSSYHALTLWGAEYDENDNLCRVYVSDTDDYNQSRAIHSMDVHSDNGKMYLSNNTNPNAKPGGYIRHLYTLSLGQEIWEQALGNEDGKPASPEITVNPVGQTYAKGATADTLHAKASISDNGYLTYQWYQTSSRDEPGTPISGAVNPDYQPEEIIGTTYYYCKITNHNYGNETSVDTDYAEIIFDPDLELTNVKTPTVTFNTSGVTVNQYSSPYKLQVSVSGYGEGQLSYQWFSRTWGDSSSTGGNPIPGANQDTYMAPTDHPGRTFYYCEVTNTDPKATGTKSVTVKTKAAKYVDVLETQAERAKAPVISGEPVSAEYELNAAASPLTVTASVSDGGQMSYQWYQWVNGKEEAIYGETSSNFTPPTNTEGTVQYFCRVTNSKNGTVTSKDSAKASIKVSSQVQTCTVTFRIVNGTWDGTDSSDKSVAVSLNNNMGTLSSEQVPAGMKANTGFEGGAWDVTPNTGVNGITGNVTYTYTFTEIVPVPKTLTSIKVTTPPAKTNYLAGEDFDAAGMVVTAVYSDSSEAVIDNYTVEGGTSLAEGKISVTISYTENGITQTAVQEVTVEAVHTHTGTLVTGQAPSCTAEGWKDYYQCSCGKFFEDETCTTEIADLDNWKIGAGKLDKLSHTTGEWHTDSSDHWKECSRCHTILEKAAHTYGDWVVTKPATETEDGLQTHTCTVCGQEETQVIPAIGHQHSFGTDWKTDSVNHWHECGCGEKSDIAAHTYGEWTVTRPADETQTGLKERECSVCKYKQTEIIPALTPAPTPVPTPTPAPEIIPPSIPSYGYGSEEFYPDTTPSPENDSFHSTESERISDKVKAPVTAKAPIQIADQNNKITVSNTDINSAVQKAKSLADKKGKNIISITVPVSLPENAEKDTLKITLEHNSITKLVKENVRELNFQLGDRGEVTIDRALMRDLQKRRGDVILTISKTKPESEMKDKLGNIPSFTLELKYRSNGKLWKINHTKGKDITVKLPYKLKKGETPDTLRAAYLDKNNRLRWIKGKYDVKEKMFTFETDLFNTPYSVTHYKTSK